MSFLKNNILITIISVLFSASSWAIDTRETVFLSQPAMSADAIAFVYANDLWVADRDGAHPRRLTSDEGVESNPVFSPDGNWIAFNAEYDGNTDIYLIPSQGGIPERLTWHPQRDAVCDFTADGSAVLFRSGRASFTNRHPQLFMIPVNGGPAVQLPLPRASKASFSPDDARLAYTPLGERFRVWKNYRGGTATTIWVHDLESHEEIKIPQPEGRSNDSDPMWIADLVYFRSDRMGEFNLFSYDPSTEVVRQLTSFDEFPIVDASAGPEAIIFERAGRLHVYDIATERVDDLEIGLATDLQELRPRWVEGRKYVRNADISPSGARAVFEMRGDIITVPAKNGDPRNLTATPGVHERCPTWSPDGASIAYLSDASGEYAIHVAPQDGHGEVKRYPLSGTGFYDDLNWSPDSTKIAFEDNGRHLYVLDLDSREITLVDSEPIYNPGAFGNLQPVWSPDSRWLAYTINTMTNIQQVSLFSLDEQRVIPISDGLSDVGDPVFDASGDYLYFFASTDAGPVRQWFAMSNADMEMTRNLYLVTLRSETPSPFAKQSDEAAVEERDQKAEAPEAKKAEKDSPADPEPVEIDLDHLSYRIVTVPIPTGRYSDLQAGSANTIYFLAETRGGDGTPVETLKRYDLEAREQQDLFAASGYRISSTGSKILYTDSDNWSIVDATATDESGAKKLNLSSIRIRIEPAAEWRQIFDEAWRMYRDYFYATNYHGADWQAMYERYSPFVEHLPCRSDLNRLLSWMGSELSVGHNNVGGGDHFFEPEKIKGGLLGADFTIDQGRYRITKIYGGLNWNPELVSPLTEPGVDVEEGDYLLAVNGDELDASENLYRHFENTAGTIVELNVNEKPVFDGAHTVKVVPIESEYALRNRDWVEGNIAKVDQATDGRVAYVYVPNTTTLGHTYFKRYFFPQVDKDAIIIDERFNGGGQIADYYINILRRPYIAHWHMRYGNDLKTPQGSIQGPMAMLIDETAGSGGDLLPYLFRKFDMGPLIGKATWGGLVGMLGYPPLIDGGYVTPPNVGIWDENGWVVENVGVPPDIEVEQTPALVMEGHDPQLEKAIEVILDELEANPPQKLQRPPYPVRVWRENEG